MKRVFAWTDSVGVEWQVTAASGLRTGFCRVSFDSAIGSAVIDSPLDVDASDHALLQMLLGLAHGFEPSRLLVDGPTPVQVGDEAPSTAEEPTGLPVPSVAGMRRPRA